MKNNIFIKLFFLLFLLIPLTASATQTKVLKVIDGSTIQVLHNGRPEKVKLLKVDTPQSVYPDKKQIIPLGKAASEYTGKRLSGKFVKLEFEGEFTGRYGMLLAYVFVDGTNFNLELVSKGFSPYFTRYGKSKNYDKEFKIAERSARNKKLGIWRNPELAEKYLKLKSEWNRNRTDIKQFKAKKKVSVYHGNIKSKIFHKPSCKYFFCKNCKAVFHSRDEAIAAGYIPCKDCRP